MKNQIEKIIIKNPNPNGEDVIIHPKHESKSKSINVRVPLDLYEFIEKKSISKYSSISRIIIDLILSDMELENENQKNK